MAKKPAEMRIVVVSSNPKTASNVESTLKRFEYKDIRLISNGMDALKILRETPVDFGIFDQTLKFISGWLIIKEVKTSNKIPNFPVMLLGESDSPASADELKAYGVIQYLKVPFRESDLSFTINSTITLSSTSGTVENKFTKAKEALIGDKNDQAVELYQELHGLTKKSVRSSMGLAEAFVKKGNLTEATKVISEAAASAETSPAAMMLQSEILLKGQKVDDAFNISKRLLHEVMPNNPFYYSRSLKLYSDFKAQQPIETICLEAIERKFQIPDFYVSLARCHYDREKHQDSLQVLQQAEQTFGSTPDILNMRGVCLKKVGDLPGSIKAYEEALKLAPMDAKIYFNMSSCSISMKDYAAAARHLEACLKINPQFPKAKEKLDELNILLAKAKPVAPPVAPAA